MINKENLDKMICDIEIDTTNTQTYREFIEKSEDEFEIEHANLNNFNDSELKVYLEELGNLWNK